MTVSRLNAVLNVALSISLNTVPDGALSISLSVSLNPP